MPGCSITYLEGGGPDPRCYRVNCDKLQSTLPQSKAQWTVRRGVVELYEAFEEHGLTQEMFSRYVRLTRIQGLQRDRHLDSTLRWRSAATVEN